MTDANGKPLDAERERQPPADVAEQHEAQRFAEMFAACEGIVRRAATDAARAPRRVPARMLRDPSSRCRSCNFF